MITEGDAAIPLETTRRAFRNQEKSKQRSAIEDDFVLIPQKSIGLKHGFLNSILLYF